MILVYMAKMRGGQDKMIERIQGFEGQVIGAKRREPWLVTRRSCLEISGKVKDFPLQSNAGQCLEQAKSGDTSDANQPP